VVAVDKVTGRVLRRYEGTREASEAEGVPRSTIRHQCRCRSLGPGRTCFRFEREHDPNEDVRGRQNRPVAVLDGGVVSMVLDNMAEVAATLVYSQAHISRIANGKVRFGREVRQFEYMGQYREERS